MAVEYLGATDYQTGSRGDDVREIQDLLTRRGYSPGPVDGIFGIQTKTAVSRFQSDRGVTIDGIVGPVTWAALHGNLLNVPTPAPTPKINVSPLPTQLVLQPGTMAQIVSGTSPVTLVIAGLGLLTLVTMSLARPKKKSTRKR
jgi:peptidoglycan hydrolase-like protein with peptidoglycan-binding domain